MTKKAAPPEKKKRKSIKRPERGPPTMRLSVRKLRQITANATKRLEQEETARRSRQKQDAAKEAMRQKGRDTEAARKILVNVGKIARSAADDGHVAAEVYRLRQEDLAMTVGVSYPTLENLRGPIVHAYDALVNKGFAVDIVSNGPYDCYSVRIRWA